MLNRHFGEFYFILRWKPRHITQHFRDAGRVHQGEMSMKRTHPSNPTFRKKTGVYKGEAVLTCTHNICFEPKQPNYQTFFQMKSFIFLALKIAVYCMPRNIPPNNPHSCVSAFHSNACCKYIQRPRKEQRQMDKCPKDGKMYMCILTLAN